MGGRCAIAAFFTAQGVQVMRTRKCNKVLVEHERRRRLHTLHVKFHMCSNGNVSKRSHSLFFHTE
jgi:phage FluMu protein Com